MAWDVQTFTPSGGDASRFGRVVGRTSGPLLIYCHGVGGSETEFAHADYVELRGWMHENGWAWVEANAGGPGWGNTFQRAAYRAALDHIIDTAGYDVTDVVLFGRSMGGVVSSWLHLSDTRIAPLSKGLILCSSVQDLMGTYDGSTGFASTMRTAYGTANRAATEAATLGHDPIRFAPADYAGKAVLFQTGDADDIIDGNTNVLAQRARVGSYLAVNEVDVIPGDHYVTRPRWQVHSSFMALVAPPPEPPVDPLLYRRQLGKRSVLGEDGRYYPVTG